MFNKDEFLITEELNPMWAESEYSMYPMIHTPYAEAKRGCLDTAKKPVLNDVNDYYMLNSPLQSRRGFDFEIGSVKGKDQNASKLNGIFDYGIHSIEDALKSINCSLKQIWVQMNKGAVISNSSSLHLKTVNFEKNPTKSNYNEDEHRNDKVKLVWHPYQNFHQSEVLLMKGSNLKHYQESLIMAKRNLALAYFLYKHKSLTEKTKSELVSSFVNFITAMKEVSVPNLIAYFAQIDWGKKYSIEYLHKIHFYLKKIISFSYELGEEFPNIIFAERNRAKKASSGLSKEQILDSHKQLIEMREFESGLLLRLVFEQRLKPFQLILLTFEDVCMGKGSNPIIKIMKNRTTRVVHQACSQDLYKEIMNYKEFLKAEEDRLCISLRRRDISMRKKRGHFIFNLSRDAILNRFKSGFKGNIKSFSCTVAELLKVSSKFNPMSLDELQENNILS
jgi:hypothetical protein